MNPQYDDLHSANRMALMTEAAVNLAAAMRIGQQQNQHQQNNQQNSQQQHQVSAYMLCYVFFFSGMNHWNCVETHFIPN